MEHFDFLLITSKGTEIYIFKQYLKQGKKLRIWSAFSRGLSNEKKVPFQRSYDVQSCYFHSDNNEQGQSLLVGFSVLKLHFGL